MKIGPSNVQPFTREPVKPAKTAGAGEQKTVPPGLERVQARLQSVPAAERNAGQATATDRISRNIARYAETQAIVPPPAPPVTDPVAPSTTVDSTVAASVDTTVSTPATDTSTGATTDATADLIISGDATQTT